MTEDTNTPAANGGWHLWVVGILGVLWNGFGCFDFTMTATNNEAYLGQFPPEMVAYWTSMPFWMWGLWALGVFGGLAGSAALLMRRAIAVPLLAMSLIAATISMVIGMTAKDAPSMDGSEIFTVLILGIALGLLAYAYWQNRRGVLR